MEAFTVGNGAVTLAASFSPGGDVVIVALHGASDGTRDFFLYRHLHAVLPPAGIGVVTFDRRGQGESTGDSSRGRFDVQVEDALAVAEAVDAACVGFWGYSQGGWVAPAAAAASDRVSFLTLVAAPGVTPAEQMMYATAEQLRRHAYDDVVPQVLALRRAFEDWLHGQPADADGLAAELRAASTEPWWAHAFLPATLPGDAERRLWIEEMDYDPEPVLARVRVPALLFYGGDDAWTPVATSVDAWRRAQPGADVVVIPHASHELTLSDGTLSPEYERALVQWLRNRP
jgi:pimeloyl-ACP methyl ester carboxylesterase